MVGAGDQVDRPLPIPSMRLVYLLTFPIKNQPNVGKYTIVPWMVWGPWLPLATSRAKNLKFLHQNHQVRGAFPVSSGSRLQASGEKNVCVTQPRV